MPYKIGIDPGHGGTDPGAIGPTGVQEKFVNLDISKRLQSILVSAGMDVVMTRNDDATVSLTNRTALLNQAAADYAISIHCNAASESSANYIATYIQAQGGEAEKLAQSIQSHLAGSVGWKDGGVREQNLHMTRETHMPAVLCECGFISNPIQEAALNSASTRAALAEAIANGITMFLFNKEVPQNMETWKKDIMDQAAAAGLITTEHNPDDSAPKWFVLAVALNLLKSVKGQG